MSSKPVRFVRVDFKPSIQKSGMDIARFQKDLENTQEIALATRKIAIEDVRERFETETDASGKRWPKWRGTYFPPDNAGILFKTGALYSAATAPRSFPGYFGRLFFKVPYVSYGALHEYGGNGMVQRSFSPFSAAAVSELVGIAKGVTERKIAAYVRGGRTYVQARTASGQWGKMIL